MRILFALPYGPSETRVRSRMLLETLAPLHDITLLALAWDATDRAALDAWRTQLSTVVTIEHPPLARVRGVLGDPRRPLQGIVSTSAAFARRARELVRNAQRVGRPFDVVHVEHLRGASALDLADRLPVRTVFDSVDCIAELARLTARFGEKRSVRLLARIEQRRTARFEATLLQAADVVTVVAERDRLALAGTRDDPRVRVVPNGVRSLDRPVALTHEPIAIFTGKLSYHANQAAVRYLLDEIWPLVRIERPDARLVIAGAEPPHWMTQHHGQAGTTLIANPGDMQEIISGARVALAPIVYSVGMQNKVLEALGCGVPVVATPSAVAGLRLPDTTLIPTAFDSAAFARETVRLLETGSTAEALGRRGHDWVRQTYSWKATAEAFEALYQPPGELERKEVVA